MRKILLKLALVAMALGAFSPRAFARGHIFNYVQQGGQSTLAGGFSSSNKVQKSYPGSTVTVYKGGTTTLATIYSNSSGTIIAGSTFTAGTDGSFDFWTDEATVNIKFSGRGITTFCGTSFPGYPCISAFTWASVPILSAGNATYINVADFGAVADGTTDNTTLIQAAVNSCTSGQCSILFGAGTYKTTDTITIAQSRINLIGMGEQATVMSFSPASGGKPVFRFQYGSAVTLAQNSIKGFGFTSTNTTLQKIMVDVVDCEEFEGAHLASAGGGWTGAVSIGVRVKGHQTVYLHDLTINTNQPLDYEIDPNHAAQGCDHCRIENNYLIASDSNPVIKWACNISAFTADGFEAWVGGGFGIQWLSNESVGGAGYHFSNVRWEQSTNATGYIFDLEPTFAVSTVKVDTLFSGSAANVWNGYKFRRVTGITISNSAFLNNTVSIDADSTTDRVQWENSIMGGATSSTNITGLVQTKAEGYHSSSGIPPLNAEYQSSSNAQAWILIFGTKVWYGSSASLSTGTSDSKTMMGTEKTITVTASAQNLTTNAAYNCLVTLFWAGGALHVSKGSSDANCEAANPAGGHVGIWMNNASTLFFSNNTGNSVAYTWKVEFN